jgi:cytochrome c553
VPEQPDYNKHVRPILAAACFKCHGADEKQRKGKLRLDARDAAVEKHAIVPGQPDESELIKRILTSEEDEVMPPVKEHKDLTAEQKEILRRWIAGGAEYKKHWAFIPPVKVAVPEIAGMDGSDAHAIDAFVLQRLRDEHLQPAPAAAKERWLRRVTLDLTGLPPSLEEIDAFLADGSQEARGKVVDRLLADKNFGEHLATDWLDVARYADTYGRHEDAESAVWRYRDWVVDAFNANLPYDQFVIWQTAGDLLPSPTRAQYIATAFNRLVPQSNEAGSNEEEFRQEHVADRVKTNATAFLGLTMECARCHDHKYDPISMRDYYSFSGFFNNIDELGLFARQTAGIPSPSLLILTPGDEAKLTAIQKQITEKEKELSGIRGGAKERFKSWCGSNGMPGVARPVAHYDFATLTGKKASDKKMLYDLVHPKEAPATVRQTPQAIARGDNTGIRFQNDNTMEMPETVGAFRRSDAFSLSFWFETMVEQEKAVLVHRTRGALDAASRGYEIILNHGYVEFALAHFAPGNSIRIRSKNVLPLNQWMHLAASYDGSSKAAGLKLFLDGKPMECEVVRDHLYRDILYRKEWGDFDDSKIQDNGTPVIKLSLAWRYNDMGLKDGAFDEFMVFDLALTQPEVATLAGAATAAPERGWWDKLWGNHPMPANIEDWLDAWLRDTDDAWKKAAAELHTLRTQEDDLINGADEIMVMREQEQQRPTHVLTRGQFDQPGDAVTPETPSALPPMAPGLPRNRLGLAQWMVDRQNPLTARVAVNRLWQHFFGIGLVATQEDFGIQGELPAHPELLDWLACDFMEHGWDMKRLCRMIALSQTYGQSAIPVERTMESNDPQNRLLARGPRHRMTAEEVRDTALAVSSLLMRTSGGAPVKPYQPEGLYEDSGIQAHYTQDHGDSLWRRSLYTFRKRTMPPPNMIVFDSPSREFCRVRRECTNTPLQALTLLNDPQFLESCRVCAEHELQQHPRDLDACIAESFRRWTSRAPKAEELAVLRNLLDEERSWYAAHLQEAAQVRRANGEATVDETLPDVDVAALTAVERALLCDDETLVIQ